MRRRKLGKTGIEIPELCLGTWGLSGDGYGAVEEAEQNRVIERALSLGVKAFETSDAYGNGEMETRLAGCWSAADALVGTRSLRSLGNTSGQRFDRATARVARWRQERLKVASMVILLPTHLSKPSPVARATC